MAATTNVKTSLDITHGASITEPQGFEPVKVAPSISERSDEADDLLRPFPTEEEFATLPRVAGTIPWTAWTVAFVEFAERFSYYGTSAVFVNFIQKDLPPGSTTGAGFLVKPGSGALGLGQRASTGLTMFNQFWSYFTPLFGAYLADQYWGRYKTIQYSNLVAILGHAILIISAIPPVIVKPQAAIAVFSVGLVVMGIGTGGFKSNISPLIAEQYKDQKPYVRTEKNGTRVIVDPAYTTARIYIYFYMLINMGSLSGSLAMVYSEHFVGFWLSYTLPTICYLVCPAILIYFKKTYKLAPPTGSVMGNAFKTIRLGFKYSKGNALKDGEFWHRVKPSQLAAASRPIPVWMTFDDAWVDELQRGVVACKVFLWYPLYWLAYNQMLNNLVSQSNHLILGSTPNDIIAKLNPVFIIIVVPIMDFGVYPLLRKFRINFSPIKKITSGFALASLAMVSATLIQNYIYTNSACGNQPNAESKKAGANCTVNLSVWVQAVPYGLVGMSEVLASITKLEYAYTKAPQNMRSTVQGIALFTSAVSAALGQALTALSEDPLLVWNYGAVAVVAMIGAIGFWFTFRDADKNEDVMNNQAQSAYLGNNGIPTAKQLDEEREIGNEKKL